MIMDLLATMIRASRFTIYVASIRAIIHHLMFRRFTAMAWASEETL